MKVYYNKSCSICRAEINLYKKQNIEEIEWVDIANNPDAEKNTSKDNKTLLRRLHVEEDGVRAQRGVPIRRVSHELAWR